jgi:hypothetical protein
MVLTPAEANVFFETNAGINLSNETRMALQVEGIVNIEDLREFSERDIGEIAVRLRKTRPPGAVAPAPYLVFNTLAQNRLKASALYMKYLHSIGRETTAANVVFDPIIKCFDANWIALKARQKATAPEVPKISKALPVTKWTEAFADFLQRVCGDRTIPLAYVIRADVAVPAAAPVLLANKPYSEAHASVEGELVARASHDHALFSDDNAKVYFYLEEATRTTSYAASIKPFQRLKQGRLAWFAIVHQYAGIDKWQAELTKQDDFLHTRKWKGQTGGFTLEKFIGLHRNAYVSMCACAAHVNFQLPNPNTRVTYLLNAIDCNYAPLQAAMALVRNDITPTGKMNDFEGTASFIISHDPVAKHRTESGKRNPGGANISDTNAYSDGGGSDSIKTGIGKTGVELRFYEPSQYAKLSKEQKAELREHRDGLEKSGKSRQLPNKSGGKRKSSGGRFPAGGGSGKKKMKTLIADAVAKELKEISDSKETSATAEKQLHDYIVSVMDSAGKKKPPTKSAVISDTTADEPKPVSLASILAKVQRLKDNKD